jgi:outer membrane protein OmpA-like peptidoglycan-associated protein
MSSIECRTSAIAVALLLGLALACATPHNATLERVRADLRSAETDPTVANNASVELYEARKSFDQLEGAVEDPPDDDDDNSELINHLAYVTEQKIQIAREAASEAQLEQQVKELGEKRDEMQLQARTPEVRLAKARAEAAEQEADAYRRELEQARMQAEQLEISIEGLKTEETPRGLVLTMSDDVLFAFDSSELQPGARDDLSKVAQFLEQYPDRAIAVEGHTDSVGSDSYNEQLSRRRADSVAHYLEREGVPSARIDVAGFGEERPVAPNDNEAGRQQNRRVEIVIENPREVSRAGS